MLSTSKIYSADTEPLKNSNDAFLRQAKDLAALLGGGKVVLVASHQSPDGDALASLLAGAQIVSRLGSQPLCVMDCSVPAQYQFLPGSDKVLTPAQALAAAEFKTCEAAWILDSGSLGRIGQVQQVLAPNLSIVNVDHHPDNALFGKLNIVTPEAASTTEILYDLTLALDLPLDRSLATTLYTGLMTDTGGFRFSNTTERAFEIASQLVAAGADPTTIAQAVYCDNTVTGLHRLGEALESLEVLSAGSVAVLSLPDQNSDRELEDLTDLAMTVRGVQAAVVFRVGPDYCRASMRIRGDGNVSRIARQFGGGGHQKAAGFTFAGSLDDIRFQVIQALTQEVERLSPPGLDAV